MTLHDYLIALAVGSPLITLCIAKCLKDLHQRNEPTYRTLERIAER